MAMSDDGEPTPSPQLVELEQQLDLLASQGFDRLITDLLHLGGCLGSHPDIFGRLDRLGLRDLLRLRLLEVILPAIDETAAIMARRHPAVPSVAPTPIKRVRPPTSIH